MDHHAGVSPLLNHGLQPSLIKMIPVFVYKTGETFTAETDCPVCLGEFLDHQELRLLPKCAHAFHVACIDTWLGTHSSCPVCRAPIFPEHKIRESVIRAQQQRQYQDNGFSFGPLPPERMSNSPHTLRGLWNYEDAHSIWIPNLYPNDPTSPDGMLVIDPGEDSRRLSETREHEQAYLAWAAATTAGRNSSQNPLQRDESNRASGESRSGTYFSTPTGHDQVSLTRTASCKESSSSSKDRSRWQIPSRRLSSFRKSPFSIAIRSYSMGTSRRHVHGLEFLDLDEFRYAAEVSRLGTTPDLSATPASVLSTSSDRMMHVPPVPPRKVCNDGAGPSKVDNPAPPSSWRRPSSGNSNNPESEKGGASLKSSSARGRSKSFRSPFNLKRSLSMGRTVFSFRMDHSSRGRIFSMDSPPNT
ncbi:hypothetical protein R1flu_017184 [Riccia fluitans]